METNNEVWLDLWGSGRTIVQVYYDSQQYSDEGHETDAIEIVQGI